MTVTTNENGVPVHRFSMNPAITNMAVATNDLAVLKAQLEGIEAESKKAGEDGKALRNTIRNDYRAVVGVMTNFAARNPDGKKLKDRIDSLEAELKALKAEMQKKLDEDEAYKTARSKAEATRDSMKAFEKKVAGIREKQTDIGAKVWQLQTLVDQTRKAEADALKAKEDARKAKEAKATISSP
jgi:chromosome segregation ATPase